MFSHYSIAEKFSHLYRSTWNDGTILHPQLEENMGLMVKGFSWGGITQKLLTITAVSMIDTAESDEESVTDFENRIYLNLRDHAVTPDLDEGRELAGQLYENNWECGGSFGSTVDEFVEDQVEDILYAIMQTIDEM